MPEAKEVFYGWETTKINVISKDEERSLSIQKTSLAAATYTHSVFDWLFSKQWINHVWTFYLHEFFFITQNDLHKCEPFSGRSLLLFFRLFKFCSFFFFVLSETNIFITQFKWRHEIHVLEAREKKKNTKGKFPSGQPIHTLRMYNIQTFISIWFICLHFLVIFRSVVVFDELFGVVLVYHHRLSWPFTILIGYAKHVFLKKIGKRKTNPILS